MRRWLLALTAFPLGCALAFDFDDFVTEEIPVVAPDAAPEDSTFVPPPEPDQHVPDVGFSLTVDPAAIVFQGASVDVALRVTRDPDFDEDVSVGIETTPTGIETVGSVNLPKGTDTAAVTIRANARARGGVYPLEVRAVGTRGARTANVVVTVTGPGCGIDHAFGPDGGVPIAWESDAATPTGLVVESIVVDPKRRIVVLSRGSGAGQVVRLDAEGRRDATFAAITVPIAGARGIAVDRQSRVLVAMSDTGPLANTVQRYREDGAIDPAFAAATFAGFRITGLATTDDDTVIAFGNMGASWRHLLLDETGAALPGFDAGPKATTFVLDGGAAPSSIMGAAVYEDGRFRLCGGNEAGADPRFVTVAGYSPAGELDPEFGLGGATRVGVTNGLPTDCARAGSDLVVAVSAGFPAGVGLTAKIARFDDAGALVTGFGDGGVLAHPISAPGLAPIAEVVRADDAGRIVVGGRYNPTPTSGYSRFLYRRLADAAPDPSFGDAGDCELPISFDSVRALAVDHDSSLLVAAGNRVLRLWP